MQIERALPRVECGAGEYRQLQSELRDRDVSRDHDYQRRFVGFYRVRRDARWRDAFFQMLQSCKSQPLTIEAVLHRLHEATGQVEASFASKLVATINPNLPVIDSVVLRNLGHQASGQERLGAN